MPKRNGNRTEAQQSITSGNDAPIGRRRVLSLTGAALGGVLAASGGAAAAAGDESASTDETGADGANGESKDRTLGGGQGYGATVAPEEADVVVGSRDELEGALNDAGDGEVVYVAGDSEIDLGSSTYTVPQGVTLASNRGIDGAAGGHLFTEEETKSINVEADARVTGLRVQGPFFEYFNPDHYAEGSGIRAIADGIEIDNCEVWGFAHSSILAEGDVHVHHNHVHHNPRDGLGYGVIGSGGHPLIEWNYFDYNRHSVASTGGHHGYTVRHNHFSADALGVVIDIHEPGGVSSEVHNNVVEATAALEAVEGGADPLQSVQVRGVPDETYDIHDNWFFSSIEPRDSPAGGWTEEAIIQPTETEWQNVEFQDNYYGEDADVTYGDVIPGYDGES